MTQPETHVLEFPVSMVPPFIRAWVSVSAWYEAGCVNFHFLISKGQVPALERNAPREHGHRVYFDDRATVTVKYVRDVARFLCALSGFHEPQYDAARWREMTKGEGK